ncbi:hypothetical protein Aduo_016894 [Ancylostoma duodenale]
MNTIVLILNGNIRRHLMNGTAPLQLKMVNLTALGSLAFVISLSFLVAPSPLQDWEEKHLLYQRAGMKGQIVDIKVKPGDVVNKYQILFTVSAMKMELDVRAPIPGVVKELSVATGAHVNADDVIVVINTFLPRNG